MSADSNNNKLEDFFRNSLNNFSTEPSSQLWERIEAGIPAKPARKIKPVYIALAGLILLLLTAFIIQYLSFNQQMKDMAQKVENQEGQIEGLHKDFDHQIDQLSNQLSDLSDTFDKNPEQAKLNQTATVTRHPNHGAMKSGDVEHYGVIDRSDVKQGISASDHQEANDNPSIPTLIQDGQVEKHNTDQQEIQAVLEKEAELLDYLASKPAFPILQNDEQLALVRIPQQKKSATSIEVYTAAHRTIPTINLSPATNDFAAFYSKSVGALVSFELNNRWDVQLGLAYSKMRINNSVSKELYYENEETDVSGQVFSSRYSYTVRTNYGDLLISSLLVNEKENDGQDIKDGDSFLLNVKFQKEIQYINLPLFVRYKMGNKRLRYSIKGGIIQRFLYDERTKLSDVAANKERLMNSASMIEEDLETIRQSGTDALVGLGLDYQLTKRNRINVETIFTQSLNEIYQDIQPFSIGIQLGLQHRLGK